MVKSSYAPFPRPRPFLSSPRIALIPFQILTGATGTLGAHILSQLCAHPSNPHIICLVRAASTKAAQERVRKSLQMRNIIPGSPSSSLEYVTVKFSDPNLGLNAETYERLARTATLIIHAAWAVNFRASLRSFEKDHLGGLHNLLQLAISSPTEPPPKFIFCSSTASVTIAASSISETISHDPNSASRLGYSRSKWIAEAICEQAHLHTRLKGRVNVLRIGQLCGDTVHGIWNASEAWPLMISTVDITNCLPVLENESLSWLPVDTAAKAVLQIAHAPLADVIVSKDADIPVFHILNPDTSTKWTDLLRWMQNLRPGFEILTPHDWIEKLENLEEKEAEHPARKLIELWRENYCRDGEAVAEAGKGDGKIKELVFETAKTQRSAAVLRNIRPVDEELFRKLWRWIRREMGVGSKEEKEVPAKDVHV